MQNNSKKHKSSWLKTFLKSAGWTLLAILLVALGFFGAEFLFG